MMNLKKLKELLLEMIYYVISYTALFIYIKSHQLFSYLPAPITSLSSKQQ